MPDSQPRDEQGRFSGPRDRMDQYVNEQMEIARAEHEAAQAADAGEQDATAEPDAAPQEAPESAAPKQVTLAAEQYEALKAGALMHDDYTRKTQELAREREALRQERLEMQARGGQAAAGFESLRPGGYSADPFSGGWVPPMSEPAPPRAEQPTYATPEPRPASPNPYDALDEDDAAVKRELMQVRRQVEDMRRSYGTLQQQMQRQAYEAQQDARLAAMQQQYGEDFDLGRLRFVYECLPMHEQKALSAMPRAAGYELLYLRDRAQRAATEAKAEAPETTEPEKPSASRAQTPRREPEPGPEAPGEPPPLADREATLAWMEKLDGAVGFASE